MTVVHSHTLVVDNTERGEAFAAGYVEAWARLGYEIVRHVTTRCVQIEATKTYVMEGDDGGE